MAAGAFPDAGRVGSSQQSYTYAATSLA